MSQEHVELVRRAWEAHSRHDNETALRLYASGIAVEVIGLPARRGTTVRTACVPGSGKIVSGRSYLSQRGALKAVGLAE